MITFNGVYLPNYCIINDIQRDVLAPQELLTQTIPTRNGSYFFKRRSTSRQFKVAVSIAATSLSDLRVKVRNLAQVINVDAPASIVFDDEPDKTYYGIVDGDTSLQDILYVGQGTITLTLVDPFAESTAANVQTVGTVYPTFSRSSIANNNGVQYAVNAPKFDANGKFGKAILLEGVTTNLLSANQSSIETDMTGMAATSSGATAPTLSRDTTTCYMGTASAKAIAAVAGDTGINSGATRTTVAAGNTYSAHLWAKASTLARQWQVNLWWYNSSGAAISSTSGTLTASSTSWAKLTVTGTAPTGAVTAYVELKMLAAAVNDALWWDTAQLELNYKSTSWILGGTTRAADDLEIANVGLLNDIQGQIDVWVYEDGITQSMFVFDSDGTNRFLMYKYGAANQYWVYFNGTAYLLTAIPTVGWHRWTIKWVGAAVAVYTDGVLKNMLTLPANVSFAGVNTLFIGQRFTKASQLNGLIDSFRIQRAVKDDVTIASEQNAELTTDANTALFWTFEGTVDPVPANTVINKGDTDAYPTIKATLNQDVTSLVVFSDNDDKYLYLGSGQDVTAQTNVPKYQSILADNASTTTPWSVASAVPDGDATIAGSITSNGTQFLQTDFGTVGSGWRGGSLKRGLASPLTDFRVDAFMELNSVASTVKGTASQIGRIEVYLLDANGATVGKMTLYDVWGDQELNKAYFRLGAGVTSEMVLETYGTKQKDLNNFVGLLRMERVGNKWSVYLAKVDYANGWKQSDIHQATFIDKNNSYSAQVSQVQIHFGVFGSYSAPAKMTIDELDVYQINTPTTTQVPVIARAGDVVEFDCEYAVVRKNGEPFMTWLNPTSDFFTLKRGANNINVRPLGAATWTVSHNARWL